MALLGPGEMSQLIRALPALPEDLGSITSPTWSLHRFMISSSNEHTWHTYIHVDMTFIQEIALLRHAVLSSVRSDIWRQ